MKTTIPAYLPFLSVDHQNAIISLMENYCHMVRYAFKRLLADKDRNELVKELSAKTGLSTRHAKDAINDARQTIVSQQALVEMYLADWKAKLAAAQKKLDYLVKAGASERKLSGVKRKIEKRQRKVAFYQKHVAEKTFPPVVFGGKKLFIERCKGNISKEAWDEARNNRLSSRGDRTKGGNPNLRIIKSGAGYWLEISTAEKTSDNRYKKISTQLYVASKKSKKTGKMNGLNYPAMLDKVLDRGAPYQVELIRENGRFFVHIAITEEDPKVVTHPASGILGIDTNPDGLALAYVLPDGNPKKFLWFGDGGLQDAPADARMNKIGEMAQKAVKEALKLGTAIGLEDLKFSDDKEVNAKFHRMSHSFCYRKLLEMIIRQAKRAGVEVLVVHPAYTSIIGRLKYQPQYAISVHQAAAMVIGRRAMGYETEKVPQKLVNFCIKRTRKNKQVEFRDRFNEVNNWKQWAIVKKNVTLGLTKQIERATKKDIENRLTKNNETKLKNEIAIEIKTLMKKKGGLVEWLRFRRELLSSV